MFFAGCQPPAALDGLLLNSRTFNIALETSSHTCHIHRQMRSIERHLIVMLKKQRKQGLPKKRLIECTELGTSTPSNKDTKSDVYEFHSSASTDESDSHEKKVEI